MEEFDTIDLAELTQMGVFQLFDENSSEVDLINVLAGTGERAPSHQENVLRQGPEQQSEQTSTCRPILQNQPTFVQHTEEEKENFIKKMKKPNTVRKTETTMRQFQRWLQEEPRNEDRDIWRIQACELDNYIGSFLLAIRKSDGSEYEPDTLTSYHRGINRFLRDNKYPFNIVTDKEFATSRAILAAKRKELKGKGKGNRPNAAEPLSREEERILKQKGCIGNKSPQQLLNKMWFNNTILFGLRSGTENHKLRWGDINLKQDETGAEYLEFSERCTKTRTGESTSHQRAFRPKQYSHTDQNSADCPVQAYKDFASHRPTGMCDPESPFYIAINHNRKPDSNMWYKCQAVGENNLRGIMKTMATKANLPGRKTNHSARKTTCTKLLHAGVAPTIIQQLTGHKNVQSVNNYATASNDMQRQMSDILSDTSDRELHVPSVQVAQIPTLNRSASSLTSASSQQVSTSAMGETPAINNRTSLSSSATCQIAGQILQNARIMNCNITVNNMYGSLQFQNGGESV